jgi:hypothetical protein
MRFGSRKRYKGAGGVLLSVAWLLSPVTAEARDLRYRVVEVTDREGEAEEYLVGISPDERLIVGSQDGKPFLYDRASATRTTITEYGDHFFPLDVASDGTLLARQYTGSEEEGLCHTVLAKDGAITRTLNSSSTDLVDCSTFVAPGFLLDNHRGAITVHAPDEFYGYSYLNLYFHENGIDRIHNDGDASGAQLRMNSEGVALVYDDSNFVGDGFRRTSKFVRFTPETGVEESIVPRKLSKAGYFEVSGMDDAGYVAMDGFHDVRIYNPFKKRRKTRRKIPYDLSKRIIVTPSYVVSSATGQLVRIHDGSTKRHRLSISHSIRGRFKRIRLVNDDEGLYQREDYMPYLVGRDGTIFASARRYRRGLGPQVVLLEPVEE